ncbi:MAG: TonB family protein [Myxococcaceae bacterium]|nr:TonB family protein [Myxococcaceae bacterium]MBH2006204.1 TonB family protein [Myxococcaceae bacterium]
MSLSRFGLAIAGSLVLHGLFVAFYLLDACKPTIRLDSANIQVRLTRLGTPRDEKLLPRLDASEYQPPAPQAIPKPKEAKQAVKPMDPKPSHPLDLLKKRFGKPSTEGQKEGSSLGTSLSREIAHSYELQVSEILRESYEIPRVISEREARTLKLFVRLWIAPTGHLIRIRVEKASRNRRFDQAVLEASENIHSFGPPPLTLARQYQTQGLLIQFCPMECS